MPVLQDPLARRNWMLFPEIVYRHFVVNFARGTAKCYVALLRICIGTAISYWLTVTTWSQAHHII